MIFTGDRLSKTVMAREIGVSEGTLDSYCKLGRLGERLERHRVGTRRYYYLYADYLAWQRRVTAKASRPAEVVQESPKGNREGALAFLERTIGYRPKKETGKRRA